MVQHGWQQTKFLSGMLDLEYLCIYNVNTENPNSDSSIYAGSQNHGRPDHWGSHINNKIGGAGPYIA